MDVYQVDKCYRSNNICCDLVIKTKQYINILQFESHRLCSLQMECNLLLDQFYGLKDELDFLLKEGLLVKYFGADNFEKEYSEEFTIFALNVWQIGKHKFSERGKKVQYLCFVATYTKQWEFLQSYLLSETLCNKLIFKGFLGKLLSEVMVLINSFVDEVMYRLNYMPFHSECTATIHTICNQYFRFALRSIGMRTRMFTYMMNTPIEHEMIYAELQSDCLRSADACLRQYVYLQAVTPFLRELNRLINQYLLLPNVHTPKQVLDRIILKIPPIEEILSKEDTEDTQPFRFVVNLLSGKLLGNETLDQNSDIRPVVEDDINFKKSMTVIKTVDWIIQQYNIQDIPMVADNSGTINEDKKTFPHKSPKLLGHNVCDLFEPFDFNKIDWFGLYNSQLSSQRRYSRRGRKSGPNSMGTRVSDDLQPIRLQTLQTPLLPPLL